MLTVCSSIDPDNFSMKMASMYGNALLGPFFISLNTFETSLQLIMLWAAVILLLSSSINSGRDMLENTKS
jgi:hypothetical protein